MSPRVTNPTTNTTALGLKPEDAVKQYARESLPHLLQYLRLHDHEEARVRDDGKIIVEVGQLLPLEGGGHSYRKVCHPIEPNWPSVRGFLYPDSEDPTE